MAQNSQDIIFDSVILKEKIKLNFIFPENFNDTTSYGLYFVFDGDNILHNKNYVLNLPEDKILLGINCANDIERFNFFASYTNKKVVTALEKKWPEIKNNDDSFLGGQGAKFLDFITTEVLALIKTKNLKITDFNFLGCSMGAYFALQMLYLQNKITFAKGLIFSPSIWFNETILKDLQAKALNQKEPLFINLWVGLKEPKMFEQTFAINYANDASALKTILKTKSNIQLSEFIAEDGTHSFKAWIDYLNKNKDIW